MSFHTDTCRWPDAPCTCTPEMFVVTATLRGAEFVVGLALCSDDAANIAESYRGSGWEVRATSEMVDIARAEVLEAALVADELRLLYAPLRGGH